ncbi:MAG: hypothetical protein KDB14_15525 [Planctomycetales bacterium]|nr:hypothetical protein [Planctomycetales bacterium]
MRAPLLPAFVIRRLAVERGPVLVGCVALVALLATASGCGGGGGAAKTPSFNELYDQALKLPAADLRAKQLVGLASRQAKANDSINADKALEAAMLSIKSLSGTERAELLLSVFGVRAKIGQAAVSGDLLKDASRTIDELEAGAKKFSLLLTLANAYARDMEKSILAKASLKEAEPLLEQLSEQEQVSGRIRYASALRAVGDNEAAEPLHTAAVQAAAELEPRARVEALGDAASALFQLEENEAATTLFSSATEAAAAISDPEGQAHAYLSLARKMLLGGQNSRASELFRQAHSAAESIPEPTMRSSVMDEIAAGRRLLN